MTNNNGNSNRLDRIENALDRLIDGLTETKAIANSNSRAIQAMMEQQATERLKHEETMAQMRELNANHSQRLAVLEEISSRITEVQSGMARMLVNHDEDRPTILRRLMAIENKVDRILEQNKD